MKYNPKINEWAARIPGFARLHPMTPDALAQGTLEIMFRLQEALCEISGMDGCSLQPSAGAQGELAGLMMMRAFHTSKGRSPKKVFIPESAHGTNPASCSLNGLVAVKVEKNADGIVHPEEVLRAIEREGADGDVCGLMLTNPNTLGVYETHLPAIVKLIHDKGGLVYGDGANTNAIMGAARPGDVGIDVIHINLHKTFTTPHGGGGSAPARSASRSTSSRSSLRPPWFAAGISTASTTTARSRSAASAPSRATSACSSAPTPTSARWAAKA